MPFQGPLWADYPGNIPLNAADLNCLVPAQSAYLQQGGLPTTATAANPPVITQPASWVVLLPTSGAPPSAYALAATTVTCGAGGVAKDNYVDVTPSSTYVVTTVNTGVAPSAAAAGNLRLYKATTNSTNAAVTGFTLLAPTNSVFPVGLGIDGSNAASTVTFSGNLVTGIQTNASYTQQVVPGITYLNGDVSMTGILRQGTGPITSNPNSIAVAGFGGSEVIMPGLVLSGFFSGPAGVITLSIPSSLPAGPPYYLLSIIGQYFLPDFNNALPWGYRARVMPGCLISEIGTASSQPGLWVDSIKTQSISVIGNGTSPQTWYFAQIYAKALAPSTNYSFAFMPIFS